MKAMRVREPLVVRCQRCRNAWAEDAVYCPPCQQARAQAQREIEGIKGWLQERGPFNPEAAWKARREAKQAA